MHQRGKPKYRENIRMGTYIASKTTYASCTLGFHKPSVLHMLFPLYSLLLLAHTIDHLYEQKIGLAFKHYRRSN